MKFFERILYPTMAHVPLGACPFCNGEVTVTLFRKKNDIITYGGTPHCDNGCWLDCINRPTVNTGNFEDAIVVFQNYWVNDCNGVKHPEPCGHCGHDAVWRVYGSIGAMEFALTCPSCPSCMPMKHSETLSDLVKRWNNAQRQLKLTKVYEDALNEMRSGVQQPFTGLFRNRTDGPELLESH